VQCARRQGARRLNNLLITFNWHDGAMHLVLLGPQVLIWFSAAYVFGVGSFWISFVETLPTDSIPDDAG
jgi:hypothetical protein